MAESKIKAEGESNDISAERQGLEVDEATLKGKETVCVPSIQANLCLHLCLHCLHLLSDEANKIKPQNIERA